MKINITQKKQRKALDIGAKTVVKTLKNWTQKNVEVSTTTDVISLSEATDIINAPKNYIVLYTEIVSNISPGVSLMIMSKKDALALISLLKRRVDGQAINIDKIGKSALIETTNLLSGSYMNALSRLTNISLVSSIPTIISTEKIKNIVKYVAEKSRKKALNGVIFVNEFIIKPYGIKIDLFLLFEKELLNILAKK
jgi:chemotaxis protein CheC